MKNLIRVLLLLAGSQSFLLVPGRWSRRVHTSYSRNKPIHSVKVLQSDIALNEEDEEGRGNGNGGGIDSNGNDNDSDRTYEEMYLDRQVADLLESPMELRSETLNELFRPPPGLGRLAEVIKPDSSYGAIFRLEGTVINVDAVQKAAWDKVAEQEGFEEVDMEDVKLAQTMSPEKAISRVFYWTSDFLECRRLGLEHFMVLNDLFDRIDNDESLLSSITTNGNSEKWLQQLRSAEIQTSLMSKLDKGKVTKILDICKINELFSVDMIVCAESGYETEEQEMLGAALRMKRPPDHCIVFDCTPSTVIAAHDSDMRIIATNRIYPNYELRGADLIVGDFDEVRLSNVRKLFADRDFEQEREVQMELDEGGGGGGGGDRDRWGNPNGGRNRRWD